MRKALPLICALLLPISAHAIPMSMEYEFEWIGENGYSMAGIFTAKDSDNDERISDEEVSRMLFEGFKNGTSLGSTELFPSISSPNGFNFNFSLNRTTFFSGGTSTGRRGQKWNVDGPGLGFQNGSGGSFLKIDGNTIHLSKADNPGNYTVNEVPEPTSIALLGLGGLVMGAGALRRRRKA